VTRVRARPLARVALLIAALIVLAGTLTASLVADRTDAGPRAAVRADAHSVPRFTKVAALFLENHGYRQVIGSSQAPFLNRLARQGALATRYYAVAHPSLPDYLAILTGSTGGVASDCNSCETTAPTLPGQLQAVHIPWRAYFEGIPRVGYEGRGAGDYTKHYNPFAYAEQVADGVGRKHVVGFGALRRDLRRGALPRFAWIAPDLLHDGHSASVRASDLFVSRLVPRIVRALGPHGVLFVGWDEAQGKVGPRGGHVALIATGPGASSRERVSTPADHYSLLATLEAGLRLPALGHAASPTTHLLTGLLAPR
jgi:phosphatidylinositol-3-phosphatase